MEQIIYISTARREPLSHEIHDILATSRRNNARDKLSGLLIIGGRRFLQVLEGPGALLDAAYDRIRADQRHFALVQLARRPIAARSFPDWEMGYQEYGSPELLPDIVQRLVGPLVEPNLRAELNTFARLHGRAA
jgi:hypothetical protein